MARRAGRGAVSRKPARGRTFLPQSTLARQVAILGLVLCAIALSVAFPLRGYLEQRTELAAAVSAQQELEQREAELRAQQAALEDPEYVAAEARRRLQLVLPGDTVYVVHAPAIEAEPATPGARPADDAPWYSSLWRTLSEGG
jgi:cell division protein FtsB